MKENIYQNDLDDYFESIGPVKERLSNEQVLELLCKRKTHKDELFKKVYAHPFFLGLLNLHQKNQNTNPEDRDTSNLHEQALGPENEKASIEGSKLKEAELRGLCDQYVRENPENGLSQFIIDQWINIDILTEKVVHQYSRLVVSIANKFRKRNEWDRMDLVQEGNIALIEAVVSFQGNLEVSFITYAYRCIIGKMMNFIGVTKYMLKINNNYYREIRQYDDYIESFAENGERACFDDIARNFDKPRQRIIRVMIATAHLFSFEEKAKSPKEVHDEQEVDQRPVKLKDCIAYKQEKVPDQIEREEIKKRFRAVLNELTFLQREVLCMRNGLYSSGRISLVKIGKILGCSREQVRLIETKAMERLEVPARRKKIEVLVQ